MVTARYTVIERILLYRRYTSRAKTFPSPSNDRSPNLRIRLTPSPLSLNLKSRFLFVGARGTKTRGFFPPWISGGIVSFTFSETEELFSLNNTGDKRDPVCCERFPLLEKRWISLFPLFSRVFFSSFSRTSSPVKVFERDEARWFLLNRVSCARVSIIFFSFNSKLKKVVK